MQTVANACRSSLQSKFIETKKNFEKSKVIKKFTQAVPEKSDIEQSTKAFVVSVFDDYCDVVLEALVLLY